MGQHRSENRCSAIRLPSLCWWHCFCKTKHWQGRTNALRHGQHLWKDWSSTKPHKNDVNEEWICFVCLIHVQRNQYLQTLQLRLPRSRNQHDERNGSTSEQKEVSGLKSFQKQQGQQGKKNNEHQISSPLFYSMILTCLYMSVINLSLR